MKLKMILTSIIFALIFFNCKDQVTQVDDEKKVVQISGTIYKHQQIGMSPVSDALVSLKGNGIDFLDTTDIQGKYSFTFYSDTIVNAILNVQKPGYLSKNVDVELEPKTKLIRDIILEIDTTIIIGTVSGNAHTIAFLGPSEIELSVYGVGGEESKIVTFEVRDSIGNPLKPNENDTVSFSLAGTPVIGGAYINPRYGIINSAGRVLANVNSGTQSGVLQLIAQLMRANDGKIIRSNPVKVIIHAGLPNQEHFTISADKRNFPALNFPNKSLLINVRVGDKYSNPVQSNTAVYFSTTSGIIGAAGFTNESGQVSKTLFSGNPYPPNGYAFVKAVTLGQNGEDVGDSLSILFSGKPRITVNPDSIEVPRGSARDINLFITDEKNNPLASGTLITASISYNKPEGSNYEIIVSGLPTESLGDHLVGGPNITSFSLRITDATANGGTPEKIPVVIKIDVSGENGTATKLVYGTVGSIETGGGIGSGYPYSIAYLGPSTIPLSVSGVGGVESQVINYEVRDSAGTLITLDRKDTVEFSLSGQSIMDGAYVSPAKALTDASGKVKTTIYSGTVSGVLQLIAKLRRDDNGAIIQSMPVKIVVRAGFPSQEHFTLSPAYYNFPALNRFGKTLSLYAQVGDKYSNPVEPGTAIYFNTTGGMITADAYTNESGSATATLYSGNPYPVGGYAWIRAKTLGENGTEVKDSLRILFSGNSMITSTTDSFRVEKDSYQDVSITISDENGNPLAAGTTVATQVIFTPPASVPNAAVSVTGLPTTAFGDYLTGGPNRTNFTMRISDATPGGTSDRMNVTIRVTIDGPNGPAVKSFYGNVGTKINGIGSGYPHSIAYLGPSTIPLSVSGVGGVESQVITYEVRDSIGQLITLDRMDTVVFALTGPASVGGTHVSPIFGITDASGKVTTTIYSGTVSGVFQLVASLRRDDNGVIIQSTPVKIVVRAGFPSQEHFSLWPSKFNFPALNRFGQTDTIYVKLGDKYSNPVEPGTAVYFNTTGGIIQGDAYTNPDGDASVVLQSANPYPPGGYARVKAQTLGEYGILVQDSIQILFSGNSMITSSTDSFRVEKDSYQDVSITISDENGNPLAAGTTVATQVIFTPPASVPNAAVSVTGLPTTAFGDYLTGGPNRTNFTMRISDATPGGTGDRMNVTIRLTINGPNGPAVKSFYGTVGSKISGVSYQYPHSIAYIGPSTINISVAGVGGSESSIITYEVRDSLGLPISIEQRDTVNFSIEGPPVFGGAYITPTVALTNASGRVITTVNSGTVAGVIQIIATLRRESDGAIIRSTPTKVVINSGLPNQSHFSISADRLNFAGYNWVGRTNTITVQVGDKYSNPVQTGTAVYFNTTGGIITAAGYTSSTGHVNTTLYSGNPLPNDPVFGPGYAWVKAQTLGENALLVKDSALILFSGLSSISITPDSINVPKGGRQTFDVNISDQHGNPLAPGTQISSTIEFTPPPNTQWSAKIGGLPTEPLGDYLFRGLGRTDFKLDVIDATADGGTPDRMPVVVKIQVSGSNGTVTKYLYGTVGNP